MQTKRISIIDIKPGMKVAEDVYTNSGQLIIHNGVVLTDRVIARLRFYSIMWVKICLEQTEAAVPEKSAVVPESKNYRERIQQSPEFQKFQTKFVQSIDNIKDTFGNLVSTGQDIDTFALLSGVNFMLHGARNGNHMFDMLHCMRDYDDSTYVHCVNVSLICNILGQWLQMEDEDIRVLTLAGLLHDIGKMMIPQNIMNKPGRLLPTEYAMVQTHAVLGYNCLKDQNLDQRIKNAALMHHERCDGSGYPNKLKREQIDDFAKIVAIADVYDAMSSNRSYRQPLCPFTIIEKFEEEGLQKYDPRYILVFLEGIVQTYIHNNVRLSNGETGEIVLVNKQKLSRPFVQTAGGFIDLSNRPDLSIEAII